jgi:hypothetical protein
LDRAVYGHLRGWSALSAVMLGILGKKVSWLTLEVGEISGWLSLEKDLETWKKE